jgi:hypothetical protein
MGQVVTQRLAWFLMATSPHSSSAFVPRGSTPILVSAATGAHQSQDDFLNLYLDLKAVFPSLNVTVMGEGLDDMGVTGRMRDTILRFTNQVVISALHQPGGHLSAGEQC